MRKMKDSGIAWIGDIPEGWYACKFKRLLYSCDGGVWGNDPIGLNDKIVIRSTEQTIDGKWSIVDPALRDLSSIKNYKNYRIQKDDLLLTKSSGSALHIGKTTLADKFFEENECYYSNFIQRIRVKCFPKYAWFILNSTLSREQFVYLQNSTSGLGNITAEDISNISFPVPPLSEQQAIASYLDEKCGKIDALVLNVKAQIERLKAYKQSLITEVVTKGLNPSAPMKDSGVDWIGKIPEEWKVTRIKNLFTLRNERNDEADLKKVNLISLYTDLGVVQHSDIIETTGNRAVTAEGYKCVYKNDIVVNIILCWMGAIGMSKYDGVTSPAYDIYCPKNGTISEYYHYLFRTNRFNGECYRYGRGIMMMRWRTYSTEFRAIKIPFPSIEEQRKIIHYLDEKCGKIDALIGVKERKIAALEAYKKSLIYECVTGKREVM